MEGANGSSENGLGLFGEAHASKAKLQELLASLQKGDLDEALNAIDARRLQLEWQRLPERIILLRHGQSEGNVSSLTYTSKGDAYLELTAKGVRQAEEAGTEISKMIGDDLVFVVLSPFERTQQTLLGMYAGGLRESQVDTVHVDPRIREQEFGNFQSPGLSAAVKAEQKLVGRFYYRRPNAESSADVYDRVSSFWDSLLSPGNDSLLRNRGKPCQTCLVVTHGLTIRLLLMRVFNWSVETFETIWNLGNCQYITLRKSMADFSYQLAPEESNPSRVPWATREIWLVLKSLEASKEAQEKLRKLKEFASDHARARETWVEIDQALEDAESLVMRERSKPFTVIDYLGIPQPRTTRIKELCDRLVQGHGLHEKPEVLLLRAKQAAVSFEDIEHVDWWGDSINHRAKMLRWSAKTRHSVATNASEPSSGLNVRPKRKVKTIVFGHTAIEGLQRAHSVPALPGGTGAHSAPSVQGAYSASEEVGRSRSVPNPHSASDELGRPRSDSNGGNRARVISVGDEGSL